MAFAPQQDERIGTINRVIGRNVVHGIYNDGDHTYITVQQECRNSLPLSSTATTLIVPLCNPNVDFVQFNKSFITMKIRVGFTIGGYEVNDEQKDTEAIVKNLSTFIGLKHASDIIGEYAVYHKGKQITGTLQSNATVESFLYHTSRPRTDLENRKDSHSIAEKVLQRDLSSACGNYVDLNELQGDPNVAFDFDLVIPFNDILIFQQFKSYPNALFGDLELRFKLNLGAFVTMTCDPYESLKQAIIQTQAETMDKWNNTMTARSAQITREYTQVGDQFRTIIHGSIAADGKTTFLTGPVSWVPKAINITQVYSTICGYRARPDHLEAMRAKYANQPWVMFSQNINFLPFSTRPMNEQGLNMTQQVYLNNTTDLILLFPTTANESGGTVSKNPMLDNLSLQVLNRRYPETGLNTTDGQFVHLMLYSFVANHVEPLKEYVNSLSWDRWDATNEIGYDSDRTAFICSIHVERPSAIGLICDGLDSKGAQVPIRLTAKPSAYSTTKDKYCGKSADIPPPVLVTVNDSYFIFNARDGGQCIYSNRPFNEMVHAFMGY